MVHRPWSIVHGPWSMVQSPWSIVHGPQTWATGAETRRNPSAYIPQNPIPKDIPHAFVGVRRVPGGPGADRAWAAAEAAEFPHAGEHGCRAFARRCDHDRAAEQPAVAGNAESHSQCRRAGAFGVWPTPAELERELEHGLHTERQPVHPGS